MKRYLLIALVAAGCGVDTAAVEPAAETASALTGPTVTIAGQVVDFESYAPVPYAQLVELIDSTIAATADANGYFVITVSATDRFSLSATATGFRQSIYGELVNVGQNLPRGELFFPMLKETTYQRLVASVPGMRTDHGAILERLLTNTSTSCNLCRGPMGKRTDIAENPTGPVAYLGAGLRPISGATGFPSEANALIYNVSPGRVTPRIHGVTQISSCSSQAIAPTNLTGLVKTRAGAVTFSRHALTGFAYDYQQCPVD